MPKISKMSDVLWIVSFLAVLACLIYWFYSVLFTTSAGSRAEGEHILRELIGQNWPESFEVLDFESIGGSIAATAPQYYFFASINAEDFTGIINSRGYTVEKGSVQNISHFEWLV